ncbi:MAG: FMN-binding protein [Clostridia bacterium]|nr:FMN-binding protein [Clostridia bacterium]
MSKKGFAVFSAVVLAAAVFVGCGKSASYADGTYEGKSSVYEGDEEGNGDGYGVATITIKDNKIVACEFKTYQTDGTLKDENYGKQNGEVANADFYNKAQRAVVASGKYGQELSEKGELSEVEAITGATISYSEFKEAVENALKQAKQ